MAADIIIERRIREDSARAAWFCIPNICTCRFGIAGMGTALLIGAALVVAALAVIIASRLSGRYGRIEPSRHAAEAYKGFRVDPAKRYYISGPAACPSAIMGIDNAWTLESDLWKAIDFDSQGLKELVNGMQARAGESMATLFGFAISDDRGGVIGDLFCLPGLHMPVRIRGAYRVTIDTPRFDPPGES